MPEVVVDERLQREQVRLRRVTGIRTGQSWLTSPPSTKGPVIFTTTTAGPTSQVPVSSGVAVAVGNENVGPTPQIRPFGLAGVKKSCSWMSPTPLNRVPSGPGKLLIGTIVRAITFQFCEA